MKQLTTRRDNLHARGKLLLDRKSVPFMASILSGNNELQVLNKTFELMCGRTQARVKAQNSGSFIITPNPEIVSFALGDPAYAAILNQAQLSTVDGIGLLGAIKFLRLPVPENEILRMPVLLAQGLAVGWSLFFNHEWFADCGQVVPGRILIEKVLPKMNEKKLKLFLLGGKIGVAGKAAEKVAKRYPLIQIESAAGPKLNKNGVPVDKAEARIEGEIIAKINSFHPNLLVVSFGPPKQEYWISRNLTKLKMNVAVGAGGTVDYLAGKQKLPPKFFQNSGLEWFWRLITQPWRWRRIMTATIVFPWKIFLLKLSDRNDTD